MVSFCEVTMAFGLDDMVLQLNALSMMDERLLGTRRRPVPDSKPAATREGQWFWFLASSMWTTLSLWVLISQSDEIDDDAKACKKVCWCQPPRTFGTWIHQIRPWQFDSEGLTLIMDYIGSHDWAVTDNFNLLLIIISTLDTSLTNSLLD